MAWRSAGSFGRSFASATARSPSLRSPQAALPRLRPSQSSLPRRRFASFSPSRNLGELGCMQSMLPLHSVAAAALLTSHLTVNVRAFCELSNVEKMGDALGFTVADKESAAALYLKQDVGMPKYVQRYHGAVGE